MFAKTTPGVRVDETAGKLTRLSDSLFLKTLIDEHNRPGGKHLELHAPISLVYQYENNVTLGCYTTVFLLLNVARSIAAGWGLQMGFDGTGPISNKKFDTLLVGITTN